MSDKDVSEQCVTSQARPANDSDSNGAFYIVGVGASAGGLEALERMFQAMPDDTGMAFVIVQHLSPDFKSLMDELLARHTEMPIHRVEDGMVVEPNSLYLIPPKQEMIISNGKLLLTEKDSTQSLSLPIDHFFRSLAQDAGPRSVAVVLSGTGSDGSRGIRDVHEAGGLVIVQSLETAKFDGMPKSAIDTGLVDVVVAPPEIAELLRRYAAHPVPSQLEQDAEASVDHSSLERTFRLLQRRHRIDFNYYKPTTIGRRIERRVQLNHDGDLDTYLQRLEDDPAEVDQLYKDLLIGVTRFFRDREAFEALGRDILPHMLTAQKQNEEFRVWVAGCGTGEEAYSMAILIDECMRTMDRRLSVKIFATDVHKASLDFAHGGVYPASALDDVTPERRERYFTKMETGYHVLPEIRKMIVFAPHNLIKDAPFTHLNLITCRNLLIYFRQPAQKKVLSLFHFGLKAGGVLFLGASESPGELRDEFDTLHERWKIFRKRRDVRLSHEFRGTLGYEPASYRESRPVAQGNTTVSGDRDLLAAYDDMLEQYMPPAILVDEHRQVAQMFSGAGKYLRLRDGRLSTSVFDLIDGDLKLALTGALQRVAKTESAVICERVRIDTEGGQRVVRVDVKPVGKHAANRKYLVTFTELDQPSEEGKAQAEALDLDEVSRHHVRELEQELRYSKENLQAAIEELETSNEELQATNEELVASNEELQSTNEELHSVNEELYTVNAEYQRKISELTELTNDMDNLLVSTEVHTLFLDENLCIRKFTPKMAEVFNLIGQDVGRRIHGFVHKIRCDALPEKIERALAEGCRHEEEVRGMADESYLLRILPYDTNDASTGVVLTLIDIGALKATQAELEQSRARYQDLYDNAPDMYLAIDAETGTVTECNQTLLTELGYREDEVVGAPVSSLYAPESRKHWQQLVEQLHEAGKVRDAQLRIKCRDGRLIEVLANATSLRDEAGKAVRGRVVWRDVTQLNRAQRQIRAFSAIVSSSGDAIYSKDLDGNITSWNRAAEGVYGYTAEEIVGQSVKLIIPPEKLHEYDEVMESIRGDRHVSHFDTIRRRKDGTLLAVSMTVSPIHGRDGRVVGASSIARDITARRRAEEAIQESQRRYALAVRGTGVGLWEWKPPSERTYYAPQFTRLLGYEPDEFGDSLDEFRSRIHPEDRERTWNAVRAHLEDGAEYDVELRLRTKSGAYRWFQASATSERDATGKPIRMAGTIRDIEPRKKAEERAAREIAHRDYFLAMLSHELRNPMGAVLNALEVLQSELPEDSLPHDPREVIKRQTRHMARLLDDLLDVARFGRGKIEFRKQVVDLSALADEVVEAVRYEFEDKNQLLHTTVCHGPLCVYADPARIKQAQVNLLTNASKYTPEGGDIWFDVDRDGSQAIVTVRDAGMGIAPNRLDNIFDLFVQAESTLARSSGGIGVGLSLARSIVEAHGGQILAQSDGPGHGSTFRICLPLTAERPKPKVPVPHVSFEHLRLLLVEDNDDARTMLAKTLRLRGFDVVDARNGRAALELLDGFHPDVAVIDIGLPEMDGYQLAREIRKIGALADVMLIALTGYGREADRQAALDAGFDAHLVKPLDPAELYARILQRFGSSQPATAKRNIGGGQE